MATKLNIFNGGTPFEQLIGAPQAQQAINAVNAAAKSQPATTPSPTDGSGSATDGSSATTSTNTNANSYFDQLIGTAQNAINRLPNQAAIGKQNIMDSYNSSFNTLLGQKAIAERNYNTNKTQTAQDNISAKNDIDASVGNQTNSLERLLGAHGSGSSSAAEIAAPYAAAKQGTLQRQQVSDTYARNQQALDTNWGDYNTSWNASAQDLNHQKDTQLNAVDANVAKAQADLLTQLANLAGQRAYYASNNDYGAAARASAPYQGQINDLLTRADNLAREYATPIQIKPVQYTAPNLDQYTYDRASAPSIGNTSALTDTISPYLAVLLGKKQTNELTI